MKTDHTTHLLLGVIATGVTALAAIAFERRYLSGLRRPAWQDADETSDDLYARVRREAREAGQTVRHEARSLRERLEDGVETIREKAGTLKDRMSDGLDRAGTHLREGAERLRDGFKQGAEDVKEGMADGAREVKEGVKDAADEARRATPL